MRENMAQIDLKQLVQKLNPVCHRALEAAAGACMSRTNYNVEIEHWLAKLLDETAGDLAAICRRFEIDTSRLSAAITRTIDRFKTGNSRPPALSPDLVRLIREAWLVASIEYGEQQIRSGYLLCAMLGDESLARIALEISAELEKINVDQLRKELPTVVAKSSETAAAAQAAGGPGQPAPKSKGPTKTQALDQFTIDLTERARSGNLDPVLGRDNEIRQMIDILTRRRQNNPILTGEAGVGKTAVVEGFAARVASGDVPPQLRDAAVRSLDLGLLQAGAGIKGEFENRLKSVIEEIKSSPTPIILFIDEAHTLIGAGGAAGQGDAANLLKPALARGELRTIAATTWAEYKKYFEKDAALARRFQAIKVEEPSEDSVGAMLRGLLHMLESHHNVRILNEAVVDAVKLSSRYISGRQLPDKAVSVLDTTCARIGLSQTATPAALEDCQRRIDHLKLSLEILQREAATGAAHDEQLGELSAAKVEAERELAALQDRWNREKELVAEVQDIQRRLEGRDGAPNSGSQPAKEPTADRAAAPTAEAKTPSVKSPELSPEERDELRVKLAERRNELRALQGELPLVYPFVDSSAVAATIAAWTGIPVGRMLRDEIQTVMKLKELMEQSIVGQSHALDAIAQRIRTSRANLSDPRTPIGVFLLAGTSGVGKTETAITLANLLYGGEQNMTVLNMSEFKEEYRVSALIGSAPGYVGFGEGGVLTEAVRRKPYSVVLLDEMEKAHPSVQDIFYQVFDKGTLRDGEGRDIDFKNTVIIMTSNAGTDLIKSLCGDPATAPEPAAFAEALFPELLKSFKPAFLGRLTIVPYYPLSDEIMRRIIHLKLGKVGQRIRENHRADFHYSPEVVDAIALRCTEVDTGARNVDHILTGALLPELSAEVLAHMGDGRSFKRIEIQAAPEGRFQYLIS
jgi:type VI secretion system protein VasG